MMRNATVQKITYKHSQTKPGWVVSATSPEAWVEEVIKPLLAGLTEIAPGFEPTPPASQNLKSPAPGSPQLVAVGSVIAFLVPERSTSSAGLYHRNGWRPSIHIPLLWEKDPESLNQRVAIIPQCAHSYLHSITKRLTTLRYLTGSEALVALIQALYAQSQEEAFNAQKVDKVRNLQAKAVEAQIRQLANEQQFAFFMTTTARLIQVTIRLQGQNKLTVSVPFSEFQAVLPELREAVMRLLALNRRRIHFKMHQSESRSDAWIEPAPPLSDSGADLTQEPV